MRAELSDDLYVCFRDLLRTRCGLEYPERKRADLAHGLSLVLSATQQPTLAALYADAVAGGPAWDAIITQLTIGETYFFRNDAHFAALREHIIPDLLQRRATARTLRLWSAGCATGEEPYSLAILLNELLPNDSSWNVSILATDINPEFLRRAREARYSAWSFRETPAAVRDCYWTAEQGHWRLHASIRRMVAFAALNLAEPCYPLITNGTSAQDLIVCRNVTIYFDAETTRQVAERFYHALTPGGWLVVGHAEPQASVYHRFEVYNFPNTVIYRKPLDAPLFTVEPATPGVSSTLRPNARTEDSFVQEARLEPTRWQERPVADPVDRHRSGPINLKDQHEAHSAPPVAASLQPRLAQSDTDGMEETVQKVLRIDSAPLATNLALAKLYADRAEWAHAQQQCLLVLEHDPLDIPAQHLLAQIYEHQGQLTDALAAYRRTVYLDPQFVPGMLGMAQVWRQLGRNAEAQRALRNVVRQLATLSPTAAIPGYEGLSAGDVLALAQQQLAVLTRSAVL